jgi:SAM-dependent methyltransferase
MFDPATFPGYSKLNSLERLFLRTCCYYPPRPRRVHKPDDVQDITRYIQTYENAFTSKIWELCADKKVLDLGCGQGGYTLALAKKGALTAVGVDINNTFIFAEYFAISNSLDNVRFVQGSTNIFPNDVFDIVISHDSFEHFERPEEILSEIVRITKPGGNLLIKFGPPWMNPWGRHMSGTIRRDRPWVHLVVPEKIIMRCHSVYHNQQILFEEYDKLSGGLNKMTVGRFKRLLKAQKGLKIEQFDNFLMFKSSIFRFPLLNELFSSGVRAICRKSI